MALIQPSGPSWAYCTHNFPASVAPSTLGATATAGASNTDGTAVNLFGAALTHDVEYLRLGFSTSQPANVDNHMMATILIDPAGGSTWQTLIPDLVIGSTGNASTAGLEPSGPSAIFDFPLWIPANASLGIRARTAHSSAVALRCAVFAFGGNANPASWWCGQRVTAIGTNPSSSSGTNHTAGNSGDFSSWTNLGSPLGSDCGALQWAVGSSGAFTNARSYHFEFGVGGERIGAPFFKTVTTSEVGYWFSTGPVFRKLPAGAQLQVRASCNNTAQPIDCAIYAVH